MSLFILSTHHPAVKQFDDDGVTPSASLVPLRQGDSFKYMMAGLFKLLPCLRGGGPLGGGVERVQ